MTTNITNITSFDLGSKLDDILQKFRKKNLNVTAKIVSMAMEDMYGQIVADTPVGDFDPSHAGMTKANWVLTRGSPHRGVINKKEPGRGKGSIKVPSKPNELFNVKWFFANNMPGIDSLEFGGYPQSVKFGSYNQNTRQMEIRSSGGFSKQAPKGMFRKNLARWPSFLRKAKRKAAVTAAVSKVKTFIRGIF